MLSDNEVKKYAGEKKTELLKLTIYSYDTNNFIFHF